MMVLGLAPKGVSQSSPYGEVLYRVNTGGEEAKAPDTTSIDWATDNFTAPCSYIDTLKAGNKVYEAESPVTSGSSVPPDVPVSIFETERGLGSWDMTQLEYIFPVPQGKKIEVRLYFAEIFLDGPGQRVFDVAIDERTYLKDFDIFAEAGKNTGLMKKFVLVSDGNLNIGLIRKVQLPKISGIEILEAGDDIAVTGIFASRKKETTITAFPNPSSNVVKVDMGTAKTETVRLFDSYGKELPVMYTPPMQELSLELGGYPKGVYYLQVEIQDAPSEVLRLIRE